MPPLDQTTRSARPSESSSPVLDYLSELHARCRAIQDGAVASYIPALAKANPESFGICVATATGAVYEVGDTREPFTIQSISKPFVYGLALEDNGRAGVLAKVGAEPTGDAFNSISLEPRTGRPRNPMINAGAIAVAGLIPGRTPEKQFQRILESFSHYAGRALTLDEEVYRSESETGHRNRAIGHMLRNFDILTSDPVPVVELYFKQCSIAVDCRDLGLMAATLANNGVHPLTGRRALRGEYVENVLSVMEMCGMYNYAGEWVYHVGLPAKSGVSGGVIAVLPGQLGIAVYSPRLDAQGNSARGIRVCQELSRNLDLHLLNRPVTGRSTIRSRFTAALYNSSRVRSAAESELLAQHGDCIQVWQLQGHLNFSTTEVVVRDILASVAGAGDLILDLRRVLSVNESACHLLFRLRERLAADGRRLVWCQVGSASLLRRFFRLKLRERFTKDFLAFDDVDLALEQCEDDLLARQRPPDAREELPHLGDFPAFAALTSEELAVVAPRLERRTFRAGETIIHTGDEAAEMFFLARGRVSVLVDLVGGTAKRLASFSPGMAFGEMAMIDRAPRSARIVADADGECEVLSLRDFEELTQSQPGIKIKLLHNLCLELCRKLRKANRELNVLA